MHQRKLIRQAVKQMLINQTRAGLRVFASRVIAWNANELPGIAVYTPIDETQEESKETAPRELVRDLMLVVECAMNATGAEPEDIENALDDFAQEVETVIGLDYTLRDSAKDAWIAGTETIILAEGDELISVAALKFKVEYTNYFPDTVPNLDNFETANIRYKISEDLPEENEAKDVLTNLNQES